MSVSKEMHVPMTSIMINNLSMDTTEENLLKKFIVHGPIRYLRLCKFARTGKCSGYAYLTFYVPEHCQKAILCLDQQAFMGRRLNVLLSQEDSSAMYHRLGTLVVKNLTRSIDEQTLEAFFEDYGTILHSEVHRDDEQVSKGLAFVHFLKFNDMQRALNTFHNTSLNGCMIALEKFRGPYDNLDPSHFTNLYVKNLHEDVLEKDLWGLFCRFGKIENCVIMRNSNGSSKGFGFVNYDNTYSATAAVLSMNGFKSEGRCPLYVARAQTKSERQILLRNRKIAELAAKRKFVYCIVEDLDSNKGNAVLVNELNVFGAERVDIFRDAHKTYAKLTFLNASKATNSLVSVGQRMVANTYDFNTIANDFHKFEFTDNSIIIPIVALGSYNPAEGLSWELHWQLTFAPVMDPTQKWRVYHLIQPVNEF